MELERLCAGKAGDVFRIGYRHQRTLARSAEIRGTGFITGAPSRLQFRPAPADTGVVFIRSDLPGRPATLARVDKVTDTRRRTTIGNRETGVTLVEHVLSALAGLRIDNCFIEIDAAEPPGLDGSAIGFVEVLSAAGIELQAARREVRATKETIIISHDAATITLHAPDPSDGPILRASYILDYGPQADIPRQAFTMSVTPENFSREVAEARTFLLESEAIELRKQGIGRGITPAQVLVFGPKGPIDNALRCADEPARHKVLDMIGDLALCGFDLIGHIVAYRSGHSLNVALAKSLANRASSSDARLDSLPAARTVLPHLRRAA